jgi:diguanylate cyclase (GGDEF)-like protein
MTKEPTIHNELLSLRNEFKTQLSTQIGEIQTAWKALQSELNANDKPSTAQYLDTVCHHVHRISGSAASFGYESLGLESHNLERKLKDWQESRKTPSAKMLKDITRRLKNLFLLAEQEPDTAVSHTIPNYRQPDINQLIYVLEDDEVVAKDIQIQLERFGYHIQVFTDGYALLDAVKAKKPDGMLIDIHLPDSKIAGVETLEILNEQVDNRDYPIIFITGRDDIEARLSVAKVGGDAFYVKPIDIPLLAQRLSSLTNSINNEPFRVIVVDDDKALSAQYVLWLEQAGMYATALNEPLQIIECIKKAEPDLILLDLSMPSANGTHLAKVIRQFDEYLGLPIVYLSAETDVNKQISALRVGGDDFLVKPIMAKDLVASVRVRAQRSRDIKNYLSKDSLTGLNAHGTLLERLTNELSRTRRSKSLLVFALIDVDLFKSVNDRFGHLEGDKVLKSLANVLSGRLRATDTIGRYGGEEFGIILPDCTLEAAARLINEIREDFSGIVFRHNDKPFNVTFSAGLAIGDFEVRPEYLIEHADKALYRAKDAGRNCVMLETTKSAD